MKASPSVFGSAAAPFDAPADRAFGMAAFYTTQRDPSEKIIGRLPVPRRQSTPLANAPTLGKLELGH
jgi:hypothetical protein